MWPRAVLIVLAVIAGSGTAGCQILRDLEVKELIAEGAPSDVRPPFDGGSDRDAAPDASTPVLVLPKPGCTEGRPGATKDCAGTRDCCESKAVEPGTFYLRTGTIDDETENDTSRPAEIVTMELPDALVAPAFVAAVPPPSSARRTASLVLFGTSAGALGVGAALGLRALSLGRDAEAACPSRSCSDPRAVDLSRSADTSAWVANIAVGTAVLLGGVGAYLFFTSKTPTSSARDALLGRVSF